MKMPFRSMSRGVIYVDENLEALAPKLREMNFNPRVVIKGTLDKEIMSYVIPGKKFVTNNSKDFIKGIPIHEYGLISTEGVSKDPEHLAEMISDAWIEFEIKNKDSFQLILHQDGKHELKQFD